MKIREAHNFLRTSEDALVYAVYWNDKKTYFLGMPKNYAGLIAYKQNCVTVVEPGISYRMVYHNGTLPGLFHWALIEKKLLDDVVEKDPAAYSEFVEILKDEGQFW